MLFLQWIKKNCISGTAISFYWTKIHLTLINLISNRTVGDKDRRDILQTAGKKGLKLQGPLQLWLLISGLLRRSSLPVFLGNGSARGDGGELGPWLESNLYYKSLSNPPREMGCFCSRLSWEGLKPRGSPPACRTSAEIGIRPLVLGHLTDDLSYAWLWVNDQGTKRRKEKETATWAKRLPSLSFSDISYFFNFPTAWYLKSFALPRSCLGIKAFPLLWCTNP